eukprot:TRINITY_DN23369_c0_g1_i1.p1 TRINITY_DN23369_c0_g1~~TRINITY_DN23369_c0_g1_i1.p1  ORF type:complete len:479 (-),score=69.56 TRINITY_DN23369_c0_g1_i1:27-1463(-)
MADIRNMPDSGNVGTSCEACISLISSLQDSLLSLANSVVTARSFWKWQQSRPAFILMIEAWPTELLLRRTMPAPECCIAELELILKRLLVSIGRLQHLRGMANTQPDWLQQAQCCLVDELSCLGAECSCGLSDNQLHFTEGVESYQLQKDRFVAAYLDKLQPFRPPSLLQRSWWQSSLFGLCCLYGLRWLIREGPEVYRQVADVGLSLRSFCDQHVLIPAQSILEEVFQSRRCFSDSSSHKRLLDTTESLRTMLFEYSMERSEMGEHACRAQAAELDMALVNQNYTRDIKAPLQSTFRGDLVRLMLIKVQSLEQEMMHEKQELDKILASNQFNMQLMATVPAFVVGYASLRVLWSGGQRLVSAWQTNRFKGRRELRKDVCAIMRRIDVLLNRDDAAHLGNEQCGQLLLFIFEIEQLIHSHLRFSMLSKTKRDWLQADLRELKHADSIAKMRRTVDRMYRTYDFLQPVPNSGLGMPSML